MTQLTKRLALTAAAIAAISTFAILHPSTVRADGVEASAAIIVDPNPEKGIPIPAPPGKVPDFAQPGAPENPATTEAETKPPIPPEEVEKDPIGAVQSVITAWKEKNWKMLVSLVLAFLMLALAKVREQSWSPFKGDRGGAILVAILGLAGGFIAALQSGASIDFKLILGTMGAVWMAVGGVTWVKRIIWPKDIIPTAKVVK